MQTIELTIDEALLAEIDRVILELSLTREAFIQQAVEAALRQQEILALERQHAQGYARDPVEPGEPSKLDEWSSERVWEQP